MGRLSAHPVKKLKKIYNLETAIETGTEHGYGVADAIRTGFNHVLSCEIMQYKFDYSKARFKGNDNVQLFFGRSDEQLEKMINISKGNILFWLDAHLPYEEGKRQSEKDTDIKVVFPMAKELEIIARFQRKSDVIIIDDAILFIEKFRNDKFKNFDLKKFSNKDITIDVSQNDFKKMFPGYDIYLCEKERGSLILIPDFGKLDDIIKVNEWHLL